MSNTTATLESKANAPNVKRFLNPYESLPQEQQKRVQVDVSGSDYYLIKLLRPNSGTISGVVGHLWQQLCYELRERGITDNTRCDDFERFVANCRIISGDDYERYSRSERLYGSTPSGPLPEADARNVRAGAKRVRNLRKAKPSKRADVQSERQCSDNETEDSASA